MLHELLVASQKSPVVAASQSVVPQAQFVGLAAVPSVVVQGAFLLHEFKEEVQKSPVVASQSVVPHAQFAGLATVPSVVAQVGEGLHRSLLDVSQKSPVAAVQAPEAPQTQGPGLAVAPSPWAQARPQKSQRQALE